MKTALDFRRMLVWICLLGVALGAQAAEASPAAAGVLPATGAAQAVGCAAYLAGSQRCDCTAPAALTGNVSLLLGSQGAQTSARQTRLSAANGGLPTVKPSPAPAPVSTPAYDWVTINGKAYRTLHTDMQGEDVLALKLRMQALGFFSADAELTDRYTVTMEYKVKKLQQAMGVQVTGTVTPQQQADVLAATFALPTPAPVATPALKPTALPSAAANPALEPAPSQTESGYQTLQRKSEGEAVRLLKKRLQELGYYPQNAEIDGIFNGTMEYKVKQYQDDLGEKATGIATPELQAAAFSDYGGLPTPVPPALPELPALTQEGFLPAGAEEYVYEDAEAGLWISLTDTVRVEVIRYTRTGKNPMVWFETDIRFTGAESFARFDALQKYKNRLNTERPNTIAVRNNLTLAFSDDFYGFRKQQKYKQGIIIENGKILADQAYTSITSYQPPLDLLAFFADGSARAFYGCEYSAQALLDMGVRDTLCFGPVLLQGGALGQQVADGKYASKEPRCALGMIAPGHYVLLTVEGRIAESEGVDLNWMAMRLKTLGAREAVNLDGGNTTALVFRGQLLNKCGKFTGKTIVLRGVRSVSSVMGLGRAQSPLPTENP